MVQALYWKDFYQLKVHANYVDILLCRSEVVDRSIKICLAVSSGAGIGAWAVWKEYAFVWAVIIAASQVLNATRGYLPYKGRLVAFSGLSHDLEELLIYMEMHWLEVSNGKLTEEQINKLRFEIRGKKHKFLRKHFPSSSIPARPKAFAAAEDRADTYFATFYGP